jgi:hypothetical protein
MLAGVAARADAATIALLTELGKMCTDKAQENLSQSSHAHGTHTPASPGGPPARISGTLRNSVGYTRPKLAVGGWEVRVGIDPGHTPPYGGHHRTSSDQYGRYLETGLRNGATYPWLKPAFEAVAHTGLVKAGQVFAGVVSAG